MARPISPASLRDSAFERALEALIGQEFQKETDAVGNSIGGRWGGILEGDWDSAMHLITEVVLREGLPSDAESQGQVAGLLEHVFAVLEGPRATGDTLRVNYLALMVLIRKAAIAKPPRKDLTKLAASAWQRLAKRLADAAAVTFRDEPSLFEALARKIPPTGRQSLRERKETHADLEARLMAFVVLAMNPGERGSTGRDPKQARLEDLLDELYARATGDGHDLGDWPPFAFFDGANLVVRLLHFQASRALGAGEFAYDDGLALHESTFDALVPSGASVKRLLVSLGAVAQAKDVWGGAGLWAIPKQNLRTEKARSWKDFLHEARGPMEDNEKFPLERATLGVYCYLGITTGLAVTALDRYAEARELEQDDPLRSSIDQSLGALRKLRNSGPKVTHALPFTDFTILNEMFLRCFALCLKAPEPALVELLAKHGPNVLDGIQYILECKSDNGLFHQCFGANEPDEGENAGRCLRLLAEFARYLEGNPALLGLTKAQSEERLREIACLIEKVVIAFLDQQNSSGGFTTFAATDREKRGLLATGEGPGAQEMFIFDAPAADTTSWMMEGLAEFSSRAEPIPYVSLTLSARREVDHALQRGVDWLRRDFHRDAGWWARYGGGYVQGTSMALRGLHAAGVPSTDSVVRRARSLLISNRNKDGGWGQDPDVDDAKHNRDPAKIAMKGNSDPELTGLALLGLLDAGTPRDHQAITAGVKYLLKAKKHQKTKGWVATTQVHTYMQGWNYTDQMHTDMRAAEALLRFCLPD